ncbi:hypothetical protein GJ496_010385 [Pomphorhynchus laevis]|nr:hypothetical protein GJ496_010385 [Pomphorhynchus laevis]
MFTHKRLVPYELINIIFKEGVQWQPQCDQQLLDGYIWLVNWLYVIISSLYYVTDSISDPEGVYRLRSFRHDIWKSVFKLPKGLQLCSRISVNKANTPNQLSARLVPKWNDSNEIASMRIIINESRLRVWRWASVDLACLASLFKFKARQVSRYGYSNLSALRNVLWFQQCKPKCIYSCDISHCYESLHMPSLLNLIESVIGNKKLEFKKFSLIKNLYRRPRFIWWQINCDGSPLLPLPKGVWQCTSSASRHYTSQFLFELAKCYLTNTTIHVPSINKCFVRENGLNHGSCLSASLCQLYISMTIDNYIDRILRVDGKSIYLRNSDDMLLIMASDDYDNIIERVKTCFQYAFLTLNMDKTVKLNDQNIFASFTWHSAVIRRSFSDQYPIILFDLARYLPDPLRIEKLIFRFSTYSKLSNRFSHFSEFLQNQCKCMLNLIFIHIPFDNDDGERLDQVFANIRDITTVIAYIFIVFYRYLRIDYMIVSKDIGLCAFD